MLIAVVVILLVIMLVCWFVSTSNKISRMIVKIDESKSGIEIQLKKRYDVLSQSLEIAKGFAKHETEIFTNLRSVNSGMSISEINETVSNQAEAMGRLVALGEAYPELKSSQLFSNLQVQLSEENGQFAASKRAFNANITKLNNFVVSFPSSIVCSVRGQGKMEFIKEDITENIKNIDMSWN